jgi:poly-gamma-glutamate synthesis protein (capsule biosynthesis protein)
LRLSRILEIDEAAFAELQTIRDKAGYSALDFLMDNQPDDEPELEETDIGFGRAVFRRSNRFKRTIRIGEGDLARNLREIENAASSGSLVIAYLHHHHWASDWLKSPDWISAFARKCIDAGASVFVSHGVPVLLPIEIYRGQPIFHSLGNFIFHTRSEISLWQRHEVWESVIGLCSFGRDNRLTSLKLHPIVIGGEEGLKNDALEHRLAPHLATGAAAERILRRVAEESREYGARIEIADDVGIFDLT